MCKASLLWSLLLVLVLELAFVALHINRMQKRVINHYVCLRVSFQGLKVYYKELQLTFHDFVEVY